MRPLLPGLPRRPPEIHPSGNGRDRHGLLDDGRRPLRERARQPASTRGCGSGSSMDPRCATEHVQCQPIVRPAEGCRAPDAQPRAGSGILHWKMMLFAGQGQIEFAGANYAPFEFVPVDAVRELHRRGHLLHEHSVAGPQLHEEVRRSLDEQHRVRGLRQRHRHRWSATTRPIRSTRELNFPPDDSYRNRAVALYNKEMQTDRRDDVPHHRRSAHQRDGRRRQPRRTGSADHR